MKQQLVSRKVEEIEERQRFFSTRFVEEVLGLSRTTIWRMVQRGDFPAAVRLSPGRVGFPADLVETWIRERV